jgi:hypothetical protein
LPKRIRDFTRLYHNRSNRHNSQYALPGRDYYQ